MIKFFTFFGVRAGDTVIGINTGKYPIRIFFEYILYSVLPELDCLFFTTGVSILINMDRQSRNGLRKNSDTGVDCSHLHGTSFVDGFARVASTEEKAIGTAIGTVGAMTREQLDAELQKGVDSIKAGKVYSADEVDAALAKEFGI